MCGQLTVVESPIPQLDFTHPQPAILSFLFSFFFFLFFLFFYFANSQPALRFFFLSFSSFSLCFFTFLTLNLKLFPLLFFLTSDLYPNMRTVHFPDGVLIFIYRYRYLLPVVVGMFKVQGVPSIGAGIKLFIFPFGN